MVSLTLFFTFAPVPALACSADSPPPTPQENLAQSDLIITGRVTHIEQAPKLKDVKTPDRALYRITFRVENWTKGSSSRTIELYENTRPRCSDPADLVHVAKQSNPTLFRWRIYARKQRNAFWITGADRLE